jgi:XTP/dITP diphosphohydrolase
VLALARDGAVVATASGCVEGEIVAVPRGSGGFGYDPLFLLPEVGLTMAEISVEMRREFSHRGRALKVLLGELSGEESHSSR